jgi:hypothetical protein
MALSKNKFLKYSLVLVACCLMILIFSIGFLAVQCDLGKKEIVEKSCMDLAIEEQNEEIKTNRWGSPQNQLRSNTKKNWGPAYGTVLDAETKKPIAGAQVRAEAIWSKILTPVTMNAEAIDRKFTQTDENGRYCIPKMFYLGMVYSSEYKLIIYKSGYVVYDSGRIFKDGERQDFKFFDNVVMLEKWDDQKYTSQDHVEHLDRIGCAHFVNISQENINFCREAREEMILGCIYWYYPKKLNDKKMCEESINDELK